MYEIIGFAKVYTDFSRIALHIYQRILNPGLVNRVA